MTIAESAFSHVRQLDRPLGARVHEPIAALRVEFRSRNDLRELFHVRWFDIHDIEALILNVQVPEIYS